MSSVSHLTVAGTVVRSKSTDENQLSKRHSSFHLPHSSPRFSAKNRSQPTNPQNYLCYVNIESERKQSTQVSHSLAPSNGLRKLSVISLPFPWYKRGRSISDDKTETHESFSKNIQVQHKRSATARMSRDRLLPFDRLFSTTTNTTTISQDDEQTSPVTELTALDESIRTIEKTNKPIKTNGYLHNSSHLLTRFGY